MELLRDKSQNERHGAGAVLVQVQHSCLPENMAVGPPPTEEMYTTQPPPEAFSRGYDSCSMGVRALVSSCEGSWLKKLLNCLVLAASMQG